MTAVDVPLLSVGAALIISPVFAFGVRRLIGVRLPVLRTVAAGVIAVLVFSPIVTAMVGGRGFPRTAGVLPALLFVFLGVVIALLVGMVFLVIAEALVPSGSVPGPVYVLRGVRGGWAGRGATGRSAGSWCVAGCCPTSGAGAGRRWQRRRAGPG